MPRPFNIGYFSLHIGRNASANAPPKKVLRCQLTSALFTGMWAVPRRTGIRTCRSLAGFHIPGGTWLTMHDKHVRKYDELALDF